VRLTSLSAEREGSAKALPDSAIERSRVDKVAVVEEPEKSDTVESCHTVVSVDCKKDRATKNKRDCASELERRRKKAEAERAEST